MSINSILEKRNKFQQTVENTSNFDFEFYGIEDDFTRNELLKKEEIAKRNIMQIQRNTIELGKILFETQELLANNKNGAFNGWFLNLGLEKDFVYREIQRYKIFLFFYHFSTIFFLNEKKDKLDYTRIAKPLRRKDFNNFVLILLSAFYKTA